MKFELDESNLEVNPQDCADYRTLVFVDYESFAYGCLNQYRTTPSVSDWFRDLKGRGRVEEVFFFADWTEDIIKNGVSQLRNFSTALIDCSKEGREKEVADFIMLDHIYQKVFRQKEIEQYVLFTGDRHFQSVVAFLRHFNDKTVGIYSLKASYCKALAEAASWYVSVVPVIGAKDQISEQNTQREHIKTAIIENLKRTENQEGFVPMFGPTVSYISRSLGIGQYEVEYVLKGLISDSVINQIDTPLPNKSGVRKKLIVDWHRYDLIGKST